MKSKINQTNFVNAYVSSLLLLITTLFIDNLVFMITWTKEIVLEINFILKLDLLCECNNID